MPTVQSLLCDRTLLCCNVVCISVIVSLSSAYSTNLVCSLTASCDESLDTYVNVLSIKRFRNRVATRHTCTTRV